MRLFAALSLLFFTIAASASDFGDLRITPVGGYRLPTYGRGGVSSTGYATGDLAVHTFEGGRFVAWHDNGDTGKSFIESSTNAPMATLDQPVDRWPVLDQAPDNSRVWTQKELYGDRGPKDYIRPAGVLYDPQGDRLWFGVDVWYLTGPEPEQWLAVVDRKSGKVLPVTPKVPLPMHKFSGGFGILPEGFATEHLEGKRFGFMAGGYRSGQGAAIGPTLAAMSLEPDETPEAVVLLDHLATAEVGSVPVSEGKKFVPEAPADYTTDMGWYYNVTDGVGYWTAGNARGCWLDIDGFEGVLYMTSYGQGAQSYDAQTEGGGAPLHNLLYVYQAEAFVSVAQLKRWPLGCPREFYDYYHFDAEQKGVQRIARGITIDQSTGLLWICYPGSWKARPNDQERYPIIVAYRVEAVGK